MKKPAQQKHKRVGASPLPKGKRKKNEPMFKESDESREEKKHRDVTGQTDTSLKHMKQRLTEVPKRSAGSKADKEAYENEEEQW